MALSTPVFALFLAFLALFSHPAGASESCFSRRTEAFPAFFAHFSRDAAFAAARTVDPLPVLKWEYGVNDKGDDESAPVKSTVSRASFAQSLPLSEYMDKNGLRSEILFHNARGARVKVFKPDTDWQVQYHFRAVRGCWHLIQLEDESL